MPGSTATQQRKVLRRLPYHYERQVVVWYFSRLSLRQFFGVRLCRQRTETRTSQSKLSGGSLLLLLLPSAAVCLVALHLDGRDAAARPQGNDSSAPPAVAVEVDVLHAAIVTAAAAVNLAGPGAAAGRGCDAVGGVACRGPDAAGGVVRGLPSPGLLLQRVVV